MKLAEDKTPRKSNLELYRIIVMILIVAHHYVVNSGLYEVLVDSPNSLVSNFMLLFGAWGKTGINCFVLITGYFMCTSKISLHKFLKLYTQILVYSIVIYGILVCAGYENLSATRFLGLFIPVKSIQSNFTGCFLIFYLLIPFQTILVKNLNKREHQILIGILLLYQTILPLSTSFHISFNYVSWFSTLFIISSYIRFHGLLSNFGARFWGMVSLFLIVAASLSVIVLHYMYEYGYINNKWFMFYLISDSNMILALLIGISTFMWFKTIRMKYVKWINILGGGTFAVLLIHANSDAMRTWLWCDTVQPIEHFGDLWSTLLYASASVLIIFFACSAIEQIRLQLGKISLFSISRWIPARQKINQ